jgi:hypothetical protein
MILRESFILIQRPLKLQVYREGEKGEGEGRGARGTREEEREERGYLSIALSAYLFRNA